ncbi:Mitogen-activated protein kinase kinase kinase 7 [Echinococcus granulosus]|uniref:Mitogen-activated protein kinase kinase kinase 7 n=1 Tax=Echinococcus granulosus TaxID=6210 RepID=W6UMD2_ECHGR|nr:Mitogen-activated protein kinase kinase kinase 7 [Echinococcus granulosus]EUB62301.1 Mitogen-activated protein kinase kinase kinase 7 [Echinococcus granulosus]
MVSEGRTPSILPKPSTQVIPSASCLESTVGDASMAGGGGSGQSTSALREILSRLAAEVRVGHLFRMRPVRPTPMPPSTIRSALNHPNIVTLLAAGPDYQNGILEYIVTELASEGDLYHLIHRRRSVEYNLSNALSWIAQLSEALAFLHERSSTPIIHRDVKPANCLIFDGGARLKLCDFGSAESSHLSELMSSTRRGTAGFMAPELFAIDSTTPINYTVKSDIFSAAMTFWEILARQHVCPPDESFFVTLVQLVHKHRRPRPLRGCPIFLLRLLERSWSENPEKRPRMSEIADLLGHIKTRILDPGVISHPLFIPPLPSDFALSPAAAYTTHDQWEEEEDVTDSAPQSTWMEDCPAQELLLLSPSPVLLKPLELSVVCDDSDMD